MNKTALVSIFLATAALCAGAETKTLESDALVVTADTATGAFSVRDKRTGREWGGAPGGRALPAEDGASRPGEPAGADLRAARAGVSEGAAPRPFGAPPRFFLSGAELVVEVDFADLPAEGCVYPAPLAPNPGDALVIPFSEGFRIPFAECDLVKDGDEIQVWRGGMSMPFFGAFTIALERMLQANMVTIGAHHTGAISPAFCLSHLGRQATPCATVRRSA